MSNYYVFKGTTGTALMVTDDKTGGKLPKHPFGEWVFDRELDLKPGEERIGFPSDEIMAAVTENGYFRWPKKD